AASAVRGHGRPPACRCDDVPVGCRARRAARDRARPGRRSAGMDGRLLPRRQTPRMSFGLGVIGCGSVFAGPYRGMIDRLSASGRAHVSAVYDVDDAKRREAAAHYDVEPELRGPAQGIAGSGVDVVLVLTSMNE